jgi:hypothetical protein
MATIKSIVQRVDWEQAIPTLAPFATYGLIMALVALFAGE